MRPTLLDKLSGHAKSADPCIRVALIDDGSAEMASLSRALADEDRIDLLSAYSSSDIERLLAGGAVNVVVSELAVWGGDELEILDLVRSVAPRTAVVIVTSRGNEDWAVEAIKRGAADYMANSSANLKRLASRVVAAAARPAAAWADMARNTRILNSVPLHFALLNEAGTILAVNSTWTKSALESQYQSARHVDGVDYLAVCDAAVEQQLGASEEIAGGLRSVLAGECPAYVAEYASSGEGPPRWVKFIASAVRTEQFRGAFILHIDVTDRKTAEQDRDQLFEQSMSLLCIAGFDGYMRRCNPGIERMLGYSHEEMMATPLVDIVHHDDLPQMYATLALLQQGHRVSSVESRILVKDGSYKWILWDAAPCVEQGYYFANGQDITDRKNAEQQLRESDRRFQLLASATQEAVWDWDLRENTIWQNDAYLKMFGTFNPAVETVIDWWRCRIHPDDRQRVLAQVPRSLVDGQQKWVLRYRLRRADESYAHVYDRGFVIFDEQGLPVRMVGSVMDITELKVTEQKLGESEERFRLAAMATCDAIWDWDRNNGRVWRGAGFQSLFGYEPEAIDPGLAWWSERIHPDDRDRILSQIPAPEPGASRQCAFEYRFRRADGTYADVFDRGFVMFGADGKPARMVGSMMDVSERRRAAEMAQLHHAELAHISRVSTMGEIATGIAHELNQPLTAISNYAESCTQALHVKGPGSKQKLLEWIDKISTNTHRAAEMIRRLRGFTRKSEPRRTTVEMGELVGDVIDLLEAETRKQQVRVAWQAPCRVHATVDRIQIEQVLVNLLRNAYDAMADNPPHQRQVVIALHRHAHTVEVSVEDLGVGIAPENIHRVFDAFFTNKPHGVGVGLAISRSIVEDHGGRLWVQPNPERGVTFRFALPLNGAHDATNTDGIDRR